MNIIRNFSKIIDSQTFIITFLAILSTYLCNRFGFFADLPSGLIGIAIIFPIVFSINSAYKRREEALKYFASLRAHAIAIYFAHRDWVPDHPEHAVRVRNLIGGLLCTIKDYFLSTPDREREKFGLVYKEFSDISKQFQTKPKIRLKIEIESTACNHNIWSENPRVGRLCALRRRVNLRRIRSPEAIKMLSIGTSL